MSRFMMDRLPARYYLVSFVIVGSLFLIYSIRDPLYTHGTAVIDYANSLHQPPQVTKSSFASSRIAEPYKATNAVSSTVPTTTVAAAETIAAQEAKGKENGATSDHCPKPPPVDLNWYAPNKTRLNDLEYMLHGPGVHDFIFNSSDTPEGLPYTAYNWCNMPHVRSKEYPVASPEYKLEYVEIVHRHHKRTPYLANSFLQEEYEWNCEDAKLYTYGSTDSGSAEVAWKIEKNTVNPFIQSGFNGSCLFPQISGGGLKDSYQHGVDIRSVYVDLLNFVPAVRDASVKFRATYRFTSQVIGQVIAGMYPNLNNAPVDVIIQPFIVDSLVPSYRCPKALEIYNSYGITSRAANWTEHMEKSKHIFAKLDSISGIPAIDRPWHKWFDHYHDNLSARLCHNKALPCNLKNRTNCVTMEDAMAVFRGGHYEYSFIYRDSWKSLPAATASFGVWMAELADNFRQVMAGNSTTRFLHNAAHDGSVSKILSILQIDVMVWPGMGAELTFELFSKEGCWYLRVLWGGQIMRSSNPSLGYMDMIPVQAILQYIDGLVGIHASKVPELCGVAAGYLGYIN